MAVSELQLLFRRCLHRRVSADDFRELLKQFKATRHLKTSDAVSTYLNCCLQFCVDGDPLLPAYLQALILSNVASLFDFITAMMVQWKNVKDSNDPSFLGRLTSTHTKIVTELNIVLATSGQVDVSTLRRSIIFSARWLTALTKWASGQSVKGNALNANNLTEVVGFLLVSLLSVGFIPTTQTTEIYNAVQQALDQCMDAFPSVSMQLMNKLSAVPKPVAEGEPSADLVEPHVMEMAAFQFESGINDPPIVATRSATVALLYELLSHGSTIEDSVLYAYLNTRHAGSSAIMFNDLMFATFDVLSKSTSNELCQDQCQIFIFNKLPFILAYIATSTFDTFSSEQTLIDGWSLLTTTNNNETLQTYKRFLQICSFHHLITIESVTNLVGEDGSALLKGLYAKDDLVGQVTANHTRGPRLVDELLKNDGNAGSISQAIYEIIGNYCQMRETQHLKDMANTIVRKPAAINAIGMFIKPSNFLLSICTLLDEWKWDDIHGESQPVYEDFGSAFLLVLAFKQRLGLSVSELGIQRKDGFLAQYFGSEDTERKKPTESMRKHIGDWIKSLYIDEALSDDLTTSCSAQAFYVLLPTLLRQSVIAHSRGKLSSDTLKAGLEYLLEPFLLPSLLPALGWVVHIAEGEPKTALLVLQILNKPPGSVEGRELHQTILAIAADRFQRRKLNDQLQTAVDNLSKTRFGMKHEKVSALATVEGGILNLLTQSIATCEMDTDFLTAAIHVHGPLQVVHTLITLLLQFSGGHEFHNLLDFVATISVYTLRSAIQVVHSKVGQYLKKGDNLFAEAAVHLYRRVELYANALTSQDLAMEQTFLTNMNVANINLDAAPETMQVEQQNEDIDQVLNEAAVMDSLNQMDSTSLDDMYLQGNDFGLGNLDDLDLDMF